MCLLLILLNDDLWFLYLSLKVFPVDPIYCFVVLFDVTVALYIIFDTRHIGGLNGKVLYGNCKVYLLWFFYRLYCFFLKFFIVCAIILLLKLLVKLYDILIVCRLNILLYGWFSSNDVVIRFKNCLATLELTFRLIGRLKNIMSIFLCVLFLFGKLVSSYFKVSL